MYKFLKFVGAALEDGFKGDSSVGEDILLYIKRVLFQTPEGAWLAFGTRTQNKRPHVFFEPKMYRDNDEPW